MGGHQQGDISCSGLLGREHLVCLGPRARGQGVKEEADERWLMWLGVALAGAVGAVLGQRTGGQGRAGQGKALTIRVKPVCRQDQMQGLEAWQGGRS